MNEWVLHITRISFFSVGHLIATGKHLVFA